MICLFIGFEINAKLRNQIYEEPSWNQAVLLWQSETDGLRQVDYQGKKYIGTYISSSSISMDEIKKMERVLKHKFSEKCPAIDLTETKIFVFPQRFIT
ncbi:MAG: hypothetical protein Tsb0021_17530 [Chlamydiales bacterium]